MLQVKIGVLGVGGRMGRLIAREAFVHEKAYFAAASVRSASEQRGFDLGVIIGTHELNLKATDNLDAVFEASDVVIDFTSADAVKGHADMAIKHQKPLVVGTTNLSESDHKVLEEASKKVPLFYAKNMSIGAYLMRKAVYETVKALGHKVDVEIAELHHRYKKDAPSGTALDLIDAVAEARGKPSNYHVWGKTHEGARPYGDIGLSVMRGGDHAGEHSAYMFCEGETLKFNHTAHNRNIFAKGAIRAALWLSEQKPGLYNMHDLLG